MPSCRTASPPRWCPVRVRWTGCACPASTPTRCSRGCSTPRPGTGRSTWSTTTSASATAVAVATASSGSTWTERWCCAPRSVRRPRRSASPTRWPPARVNAATSWAGGPRTCCCAWSSVSPARQRSTSSSRPGPATGRTTRVSRPLRTAGSCAAVATTPSRCRALCGSTCATARPVPALPCAPATASGSRCTTGRQVAARRRGVSRMSRWRSTVPSRRGGHGRHCTSRTRDRGSISSCTAAGSFRR